MLRQQLPEFTWQQIIIRAIKYKSYRRALEQLHSIRGSAAKVSATTRLNEELEEVLKKLIKQQGVK